MVSIVGRYNTVNTRKKTQVLGEMLMPLAVSVDVFPGRGPVEREFVGPCTHNIAVVAVVQLLEPVRQSAVE